MRWRWPSPALPLLPLSDPTRPQISQFGAVSLKRARSSEVSMIRLKLLCTVSYTKGGAQPVPFHSFCSIVYQGHFLDAPQC